MIMALGRHFIRPVFSELVLVGTLSDGSSTLCYAQVATMSDRMMVSQLVKHDYMATLTSYVYSSGCLRCRAGFMFQDFYRWIFYLCCGSFQAMEIWKKVVILHS